MTEREQYGLGLKPGTHHYRAYVGPPEDYDLMGALQASLLFACGLRETHYLVDVGCGSLRAGRLLIPYLREGCYFGIEPIHWLVEEGIEKEVGQDLIELKRPTFRYVSDFSLSAFQVKFHYAMAHSIFSHTYPDMTVFGLKQIAEVLAPRGLLLATYRWGRKTPEGTGWLYPGVVPYPWKRLRSMCEEAGLVAAPLEWEHPRQKWFVAGLPSARQTVCTLSRRIHPPFHQPLSG
jgi:SAM-dependent methyltransferase